MSKQTGAQKSGKKVWHCPVHGDFANRFRWSAHRRYCQAGKGPNRIKKRGPGRPKKIDAERLNHIMYKLNKSSEARLKAKGSTSSNMSCQRLVNGEIVFGIKRGQLLLKTDLGMVRILNIHYGSTHDVVNFIRNAVRSGCGKS